MAAAYSGANTLGAKLDIAGILNLALVLFGAFAVFLELKRTHGAVDLNSVIAFIAFGLSLLFLVPLQ